MCGKRKITGMFSPQFTWQSNIQFKINPQICFETVIPKNHENHDINVSYSAVKFSL